MTIDVPPIERVVTEIKDNPLATLSLLVGVVLIILVIVTRGRVLKPITQPISTAIRTLTQRIGPPQPPAPPKAILVMIAGPTPGQQYNITNPSTYIGRELTYVGAGGIIIQEPTVSGLHALIEEKVGGFFISDQGSRNQVYVNNLLVPPAQERQLQHGDIIRLGAVQLQFLSARGGGPTAPFGPSPYQTRPMPAPTTQVVTPPGAPGTPYPPQPPSAYQTRVIPPGTPPLPGAPGTPPTPPGLPPTRQNP